MSSEIIKKYLESLRGQKQYDDEFIDVLSTCNKEDEDGKITAVKILKLIDKRYAESKENKT